MLDIKNFKKNPTNAGWIMGWLVYDEELRKFDSIYKTREEAMARTEHLGKPYAVSYGSHLPGTDEYMLESYPE